LGEHTVLEVVERGSGRALAGAEVFIGPGELWKELGSTSREGPDVEDLLRDVGRRFVSDAEGRVALPADVPPWCLAVARLDGLFGRASYGRSVDEPARIELQLDRTLAIRVVDEHGETVAGVPVALRVHGASYDHVEWMDRTGEDGLARLRHFDLVYGDEEWGCRPCSSRFPWLGRPRSCSTRTRCRPSR
jgi:hypothetical protein